MMGPLMVPKVLLMYFCARSSVRMYGGTRQRMIRTSVFMRLKTCRSVRKYFRTRSIHASTGST